MSKKLKLFLFILATFLQNCPYLILRGPQFKNYENYQMQICANNTEDEIPEVLGDENWDDLDLPKALANNLLKMKMNHPTPIQRLACNVIKQRKDCIAIAETGQVDFFEVSSC